MNLRALLKFRRYVWSWENYLLLARTVAAARLVRRRLGASAATPKLAAALPVVNDFYLPPQPGWQISDAEKVARFASFVVNFPTPWGQCLQRSLIVYRLLNGYGIAARLCIGVDREDAARDGHVWVINVKDGGRPVGESVEPRARYQTIFASPLPPKPTNLKFEI
jgi:hypothetical protein